MPKIIQFKLSGTPCFRLIHPAVTGKIQERFDSYHQSGMDIDKAMVRAVSDHLKMLEQDRAEMVDSINRQLIESHPDIVRQEQEAADVNGQRSSSDLERDSEDAKAPDAVGAGAVPDGRRADNSGRQSGSEAVAESGNRPGSDLRVPGHETPVAGERRDTGVSGQEQQLQHGGSAAGSELSERSGDTGVSRPTTDPVATKAVERAATKSATLQERIEAQKQAQDVPVKPGDATNIDKSLPMLLDGQREDVAFAENRFAKPDGYGVMFTNGTGTGKTFTGLGIVKRFERQGKTNTIIVTTNDTMIQDWANAGKTLLLDISPLQSTKDAGKGIVVTTYENFYANEGLVKRNWDLVVFDESHKLLSNMSGTPTRAMEMMRVITKHPAGAYKRAQLLHGDLQEAVSKATKLGIPHEISRARAEWDKAVEDVRADVAESQSAKRARTVFLSATPFAYDKSIDYANGYLFDYGPEPNDSRYNAGNARERFFMQHFGYRMRTGKLTEPAAEVDQGLMQRQFNSWLKKEGVLSTRMLDVPHDYDRKFVLVESAIGRKIDEGLNYLRDNEQFRPIYDIVMKDFDHLTRRFLLEAIKAKEVIPHIKEHVALGRKVVVFHDYKKGGGTNPFDVRKYVGSDRMVDIGTYPNKETVPLGDVAAAFISARPDLIKLPFGQYGSVLDTLTTAFPDAMVVNGDESKTDIRSRVAQFQADNNGKNIIIVQADKGKEGISLHDTTGVHPRVMFNLGLPTKPTQSIQQEGRIYRTGQASDAMMRYLNTGTNWERYAFATTIARRASTAENLGQGEQARMLLDAFIQGFEESDDYRAGHEGEGTGGKERDRAANNALTEWDRAMTYYFGQRKGRQNDVGKDYFATPEPLAYKMVEWADIKPGDHVLEPSAGHGAIARFFPDHANRRAIEPSLELSSRLSLAFDGDIKRENFEDHHVGGNKYDAIVMNPPFGTAGKTAMEHLEKASKHLRDGGRVVALVPAGPSMDKRLDKWLYEENVEKLSPLGKVNGTEVYAGDTIEFRPMATPQHMLGTGTVTRIIGDAVHFKNPKGTGVVQDYNIHSIDPTGKREKIISNDMTLVADIQLPTVTFDRAGTKINARIVILDKNRPDDGTTTRNRDYTAAESIKDFFDRIKDADMPGRKVVEAPAATAQPDLSTRDSKLPTATTEPATGMQIYKLTDLTHSRTGEKLYAAKLGTKVSSDEYKAINAKVKANGGYWSKFAKAFLFKSEADRSNFMGAVTQYSHAESIGASGLEGDTIAPAARTPLVAGNILARESKKFGTKLELVDVKGENSDALRAIGKAFGLEVLFYRQSSGGPRVGESGLQRSMPEQTYAPAGFVNSGATRTAFLNTEGKAHALFILGHEISHTLELNSNEKYWEMARKLAPLIDDDKFADRIAKMEAYGGIDKIQHLKELIADLTGEMFITKDAWDKLAASESSIFKKLATAVLKAFAKVKQFFIPSGVKASSVFTDLDAAHKIIRDALQEYARAHGDTTLTTAAEKTQYSHPIVTATRDYLRTTSTADMAKATAQFLNPTDISRVTKSLDEAFPRLTSAMGYMFNTPVFQGERDARIRKAGEVSIKDFVDTGINRAENNMEFQLAMQKWDGLDPNKPMKAPTLGQRLKEGVTTWESHDTSTEWGRIEQDVRKNLDQKQQAALDILQREGDVNNTVYGSLSEAIKNKRIAAAAPTQATFDAYQRVRTFIDVDMANAREDLIRKLGEATGADKKLIASTIKAYREHLGKLQGWMPRKHGEGVHQVNVYHTIKALPFKDKAITDGHAAILPFYAGKEVNREIRQFARDHMLLIHRDSIGAPIVIASDKTREKIQDKINSLTKKLDQTPIVELQDQYREQIAALKEKLAIASRPADERIAEFMEASKQFLDNVRAGYEAKMQELRDQADKAGHISEKRRIKAEMTALGDGSVKVKVYMRLSETQRLASKLKAEVMADIPKVLDHVYHQGEEYTTTYKTIDPKSEGMFGDMAGDFAAENIIKNAIDRAQQTGKVDDEDAAGVRQALFRNYADIMLSRGAGRSQIRRAPYLIQGYDQTNTNQIYHDYMTATAGMLSKAMYAKQQFDNYRYAPADIKPWAEKYIKDTLRNMGYADRLGGDVRAMATFMYLGLKVSSILVNGTQTWTLGVAELGRRTQQNSVKAIGAAQLDILKGRLSKEEQAIFNNQLWKEQEMATAIHEMSGHGEGVTGKASSFLHTLVGKSLLPFQEMEMLNRRTMVLASYRSFLADGMSKEDALSEAMDVNRKTNFEMSRANLPGFAHNPVGRTVYALQSFVWNNWNWIYNRATSGEKADMLALLKYAGMIAAFGGAAALAGGDEINKLIRRLTGKDYKLAMQVWSRKRAKEYGTAGELLNAMMWHGGMGAMGVNISNAMRLNIPMSGFITGESTAGESAMGIWSGLYDKAGNTVKYASRGEGYKAVESAMPEAIASPMKAYRMMTQGATTSHGKLVLDEHGKPLKYSGADAAKRAIGLQPAEQSFRSEATQSGKAVQAVWNEKRGTLLDRMRTAKDGDERKAVAKDILQFNRDIRKSQAWPLVGIIGADALKRSAAAKPDMKRQNWLRKTVE